MEEERDRVWWKRGVSQVFVLPREPIEENYSRGVREIMNDSRGKGSGGWGNGGWCMEGKGGGQGNGGSCMEGKGGGQGRGKVLERTLPSSATQESPSKLSPTSVVPISHSLRHQTFPEPIPRTVP